MLRSLHLSIISFCILLIASKCSDGCESPNTSLTEKLTQYEVEHRKVLNNYQELNQQFQDLTEQREAILEGKKELDELMALKDELELKLAELRGLQGSQEKIDEIEQQLKTVKDDIISKDIEIKQLQNNQKYQFDILNGQVKNTNQTVQAAKADLELLGLQVNKMQSTLDSDVYAKTKDLAPINKDIKQLQEDLKKANEKLKQAASVDQLQGITGKIGIEIKNIQNALTTRQDGLQQEIQASKEKAITEASQIVSKMIETATQKMAQISATKKEDKEQLEALQQEIKKVQADAARIKNLQQEWDAVNKVMLQEANKKAEEALKALDELQKSKSMTTSQSMDSNDQDKITSLLDTYIQTKEKAEKARLGLSDTNNKSIQIQALELAQHISGELKAINLRINTINSRLTHKETLSPQAEGRNNHEDRLAKLEKEVLAIKNQEEVLQRFNQYKKSISRSGSLRKLNSSPSSANL